jgi:hypothetical protein
MKLHLVAHSPNIETIIATSMLTTTSGALPSILFNRLLVNPQKVKEVIGRIEVQHGNILEHNRIVWKLEANANEVLDIMLRSRFFNITKVSKGHWVVSGNLRTIVEYNRANENEFSEQLIESIKEITPNIYKFIRRPK